MLFGNNCNPSCELVDATARETGIDSDRIREWCELKRGKMAEKMADKMAENADKNMASAEMSKNHPASDYSDTISTTKETADVEFSDEESSERLKIVENDHESSMTHDSPAGGDSNATSGTTPAENKSLKTTGLIDNSCTNSDNDHSNRRMRTLISPDQAEVLYREYLEVFYYLFNNIAFL